MKKYNHVIMVILLACILTSGTVGYLLLFPQFFPKKTTNIYIDRDDTADSIYNKVKETGCGNAIWLFHWLISRPDFKKNIHTGCYRIRPHDSNFILYRRISRGHQTPVNLTIGSVRTLGNLAASIGKQLMIDSTDIAHLMNDSSYQMKLGFTYETEPCLFIPDTYQVYWNISTTELFEKMKKEYHHFWNKDRLNLANSIGLTPNEVTTIASIVDEETNNNTEKPMIAGLYINRLHQNLPLQADPTVKFALKDFALKRISNANLSIDSPYNTYRRTGLPPGPIRIPSQKGINSVLHYVRHNYIYMCAKGDFSGTHAFASNYNEHIKNARLYWKELNKRKIFK